MARFGGDEFVVIARGRNDDSRVALADRLRAALTPQFHLPVGSLSVSASVGVVEATPGSDPETVLSEADAAMYAEKDDRVSIRRERPVADRRELADQLTAAFANGEIIPHYQPIVLLGSGEWVGIEALARWEHPERGLMAPSEFLDVIEDTGRTGRLGEIILAGISRDMRRLRDVTGATPWISVNASAAELADEGYPSLITEILREGGIAPHRLTVELSEREVLHRLDRRGSTVPTSLAALADAGVRRAVDDFGTGFSSLMHLVSFPIDVIKIDRSFVAGIVNDTQRRSVIAALTGLASATGMDVVAEGVEHNQQISVLQDLGCRLAQGHHYSKPMPYAEMEMAFRTEALLRP